MVRGNPGGIPAGRPFSHLFRDLVIYVHFMLNLAHFWLPFGALWLTLGSLWLTLGLLLAHFWCPLAHFWCLGPTFGDPDARFFIAFGAP